MTYKIEPEQVLDLIKEVKVWRLGNWDGCCCSRFSVRDVDVDIACGKGRKQGIYIHSGSMDYMEGWGYGPHDEVLKPIAEEVRRQVMEASNRGGDFPIFYRAWDKEKDDERIKVS